ncbi:hypothetical protein MHU86_17349 [Fragilaria crotonensis]|nr:hypothetical protein MHU86_17349 [Fragilaria crotonensis]
MGFLQGSRLAKLLTSIVLLSGCTPLGSANAATSSAPAEICPCEKEVVGGGIDVQHRELQNASNESVVHIAVLFDTTELFNWTEQLVDFTFSLINNHTDRWVKEVFPDGIFSDGTIVNYNITNTACNAATAAAEAYWKIRNNWDGIVHGVVGPRCSGASITVGGITNLENITQVSPSSTSYKLSDKNDFPLFSRLVANDTEGQALAMVALLRSFQWDRVSILSTDTQYANDFSTAFEKLWKGMHQVDGSNPWEGKVAYSSTITFDKGKIDSDSVVKALEGVPTGDPKINSRVILLVAEDTNAYPILKKAGEIGFQNDTIWVGPQAWVGRDPPDDFAVPEYPGYLGLVPFRNSDAEEYQTYFKRLQEVQGLSEMSQLPSDFTAPLLVDSILALVKALSMVSRNSRRIGSLVTAQLRNLTFQGVSGNVSFTTEGDRSNPRYTILNMQKIDGKGQWVEVGDATTSLAQPNRTGICVAARGCNPQPFPSDKYPVPVEIWVIAVISVLLVLLVAVLLKYWRSRRGKAALKSNMSDIEKRMQAMQKIDDEIIDIDDKVEAAKRRQASLMQKRAALIERPETWSGSNEVLVEVLPDDTQYWAVCNRLRGDMSDAHISKLWRIQNISIWTYYSFHKDRLEMNGIDHNEKTVWHGTSSVDPSVIYNDRQDGFMMQYSRSGLWGRGIYFAEKSSYSKGYSYQPFLGTSGLLPSSVQRPGAVKDEHEMFLTKLLVGKEVLLDRDESPLIAAECKKLIIPPTDPVTNLKYNTVTGHTAGSQVWVVYENGRAYPDYLVRYYRGSRDRNRTPFENEDEAREGAPDVEMGNGITFIWEYEGDDDWTPFSDSHQVELETAFQSFAVSRTSSSSLVRIHAGQWEYVVDVVAMLQRNIRHPNNRQRSVRRRQTSVSV